LGLDFAATDASPAVLATGRFLLSLAKWLGLGFGVDGEQRTKKKTEQGIERGEGSGFGFTGMSSKTPPFCFNYFFSFYVSSELSSIKILLQSKIYQNKWQHLIHE